MSVGALLLEMDALNRHLLPHWGVREYYPRKKIEILCAKSCNFVHSCSSERCTLYTCIRILVRDPQVWKLNKNGWTGHGMVYFSNATFQLAWTLSIYVWLVCSAKFPAEKNSGQFCKRTVQFLYENYVFFFFRYTLFGCSVWNKMLHKLVLWT